jgi:hypothetical protein
MKVRYHFMNPHVPCMYREGSCDIDGCTQIVGQHVPYVPSFFSLMREDGGGGQNYEAPLYMWRAKHGSYGSCTPVHEVERSQSHEPSRYMQGTCGFMPGLGGAP